MVKDWIFEGQVQVFASTSGDSVWLPICTYLRISRVQGGLRWEKMSFKSVFHDMKNDLGSVSRKAFNVRFGRDMRSRSHRVVQDSSLVPVDAFEQSRWANMLPELLRDVLTRIEASEGIWPGRKSVVACAGVCRNWRDIVKEIVRSPEVSGKLTFPISLKQPGPRGSLLQCYIRRNRNNQTYYLYLSLNQASVDDGKFLLAARRCKRPTCTDYIISLNSDDTSRGSNIYIGKLRYIKPKHGIICCPILGFSFSLMEFTKFHVARSNFLGTKFTIYNSHPANARAWITRSRSTRTINMKQVSSRLPSGSYPIAHISYELNVMGSRGPRRMNCIMDNIPASSIKPRGVAPTQTEFICSNLDSSRSLPFFRSRSTRLENFHDAPLPENDGGKLVLKNKAPRWHEQLQCWCLNFNGRVTVASVKNFQLVASPENCIAGQEHENIIIQFGKVGKDVFTMDYQYPVSAFQAFAICLSSFDTKIACE